ncbi:MAG: 3-deoxy-D-manno-octulosonic acid transferase [Lentisphaeria bacterium]|nr:3-deoxy-D-manno-octulosonic acid transferase [Lentisphaeria bacterium]
MMRLLYNLFLPLGFLFFIPGLLYKYRHRGGWKDTFGERFGKFSPERIEELKAFHGAVWVHAVSVGETVVALSLLRKWSQKYPEKKFVISTTTTTGQELARKQCLENTAVIFCPIDFKWMVKRTLNVVKPSELVIFETEIWPNLIWESKRRGIPVALVNGRMSDHSAAGYRKLKLFFGPLLQQFDSIMVQTEADARRYLSVSPQAAVRVCGNLKFDQTPPENIGDPGLAGYFGEGDFTILLAVSTHPGEEEVVADSFADLKKDFPGLRLVLVPRHAERGEEIAAMLSGKGLSFARRSLESASPSPVEVLLADTTGEMFKFINASHLVIMGKSLAGHDEGHNLIEPALLDKPIVTGSVLRNFRFILNVLQEADGVVTIDDDARLSPVLRELLQDPGRREELGRRGGEAIRKHCGATEKTISRLTELV